MRRLNSLRNRVSSGRRGPTWIRKVPYLECLEDRALPAPLTIQPTLLETVVGSSVPLPPLTATGGGITLNTILPILNSPSGIALDSSGTIYVANSKGNTVSKVTAAGAVRTFVPATAGLDEPSALAFDNNGILYVANSGNNTVSKVSPLGIVSTFVPNSAGLSNPDALAFDDNGNLFVANNGNSTVSKVTPDGTVTTFLAKGTFSLFPSCLAFDGSGNLYVGSAGGASIEKVSPNGTVTPFVSGLFNVSSLAFDNSGLLYAGAGASQLIDRINQSGVVSPFLTNSAGVTPAGLTFHNGSLFVADNSNNTVENVTLSGTVTTLVADTPAQIADSSLAFDNKGNLFVAAFKTVQKVSPSGEVSTFLSAAAGHFFDDLATDNVGNLFVNDSFNSVEKVTPGGVVTTVVSVGSGGLTFPLKSLAVDNSGNLYIVNGGGADVSPDIVSKVTPDGSISTFVSDSFGALSVLVAGMAFDSNENLNLSYVFPNFGLPFAGPIVKVTPKGVISTFIPSSANLYGPLAFDSSGNLYVANQDGGLGGPPNTVEKVTPNGTISTFIPASAGLNLPSALVFDASDNLYVVDIAKVVERTTAVPSFAVSAEDAAALAAIGLTLDPDGTFSGKVTAVPAANPLQFTVNVADLLGDSGSAQISLTVDQPGTMSGVLYYDYNCNGVQDTGEPGLAGQTLFLDLKNSGNLDSGDPMATTDANGDYSFTLLPAGAYTVRPVALGGVFQSKPRGGSYQVSVTAGGTDSGIDFSNVITSASAPLGLPPDTPFPSHGNANADYVEAVYRTILGRDADAGGLNGWTALLNSGVSRLEIVRGISLSPEHFTQQVRTLYVTLLGRPVDPSGQGFWVGQLQSGLRQEQVVLAFLNSPEYVGRGDKAFVDSMYQTLLGRGFNASEEAYWLGQLGDDANGNPVGKPTLTHLQVASDFLFSTESLGRLVHGYYQVFLQRQADSVGLNGWVALLQQGLPFGSVGEGFLTSNEFYTKAAANH